VRQAASRIIKGKGATWYGIGAGIARVAKAVIGDENALFTCSTPTANILEGTGVVSLSLPRIINRNGIVQTLVPPLDSMEREQFLKSAEILFEAAQQIGVDNIE